MTILFKLSWDAIMIAVACYWFAKARIAWREGSNNYVKLYGPKRGFRINPPPGSRVKL